MIFVPGNDQSQLWSAVRLVPEVGGSFELHTHLGDLAPGQQPVDAVDIMVYNSDFTALLEDGLSTEAKKERLGDYLASMTVEELATGVTREGLTPREGVHTIARWRGSSRMHLIIPRIECFVENIPQITQPE